MKTKTLLLIIVAIWMLAACAPTQVTTPTPHGDPLAPIATVTPEVFIPLTQAIPARVQLNGITLAVQGASLGTCATPDCPSAPGGTRYLGITLQALDLPSDQSLDYKNLPQGIAIHDDTGTTTPFAGLYAYTPEMQVLTLYFTVPETATIYGLQWPSTAEIPLTVDISETPTAQAPSFTGTNITYSPLSLVVPMSIADGASGGDIPSVTGDDAAWWQKTPGHLEVSLNDYYVLQGKAHQPVIYVFPAQAYAELVPVAFESMHRLNNILYDPNAPISPEQLPQVPFFNSHQAFASHIQVISFQNGKGVRFLTEYAQYAVSANNSDLFYEFQGFTNDGTYYVVAILPTTMPLLAETSDGGAPLPPGGIPYTYFTEGSNFDAQDYYTAVTDLLTGASPESFSPSISQLDLLIQSMRIAP